MVTFIKGCVLILLLAWAVKNPQLEAKKLALARIILLIIMHFHVCVCSPDCCSVCRPDRDVDIETVLAMSPPQANVNVSALTSITEDELSLVADICAVASESAFNESSIYEG